MKTGYLMLAAGGAALLAGCGPSTVTAPPPALVSTRPMVATPGLERVIGQNAKGLTALFGQPDQDMREATARKLQFTSGICVLDAYLYARKGGQDAVVTYIDTRQPDGGDIDRATCVAALTKR